MYENIQLFSKYILNHCYLIFLKNAIQGPKNSSLMMNSSAAFFMIVHCKFAMTFYSTQLSDMLCYELPMSANSESSETLLTLKKTNENPTLKIKEMISNVLVYNFHNLTSQERLFIFVSNTARSTLADNVTKYDTFSITELFPNANWLEREIAELHGALFGYKRDVRNLMLTYGDNTNPFQKYFPSVGLYELFYDSRSDLITQTENDVQN